MDIYLFTWSPKGNTLDPSYTYADHVDRFFKKFRHCMVEFEVNLELNANGNCHYHGYYKLKDSVKWFKQILPLLKYNGFIKINKVKNNFEKAIEYARKDRHIIKKIIKDTGYPIPFTHNDIKKERSLYLGHNIKNSLLDYGITIDWPESPSKDSEVIGACDDKINDEAPEITL